MVMPSEMNGAKTCDIRVQGQNDPEVVEVKGESYMCGVTMRNRVRNEEMRRRATIRKKPERYT